MKAHTLPANVQHTPLSNKHRNKDHQRGPEYQWLPSADVDRKHMMDDAQDCTIVLPTPEFTKTYTRYDANSFNAHFSSKDIETISKEFRAVVEEHRDDPNSNARVLEKALSAKWVRTCTFLPPHATH